MKTSVIILWCLTIATTQWCYPSAAKTLDLSHSFDGETVYWPGWKPFQLNVVNRNYTKSGYYYEANTYAAAEHGGTHLDAPSHFCDLKVNDVPCWRLHEIPASRLHGPAVVVDISARASWPHNRDAQLLVEDLEAWETQRQRRIPDGAVMFVRSGWGRFYGDHEKYLGNKEGNTADLHFPGISKEAAAWIVHHRPNVSMVGIDTPSLDVGASRLFLSHRILAAANILGLENVARLDELVEMLEEHPAGVEVFALPMKIRDGSGGPARILAVARG